MARTACVGGPTRWRDSGRVLSIAETRKLTLDVLRLGPSMLAAGGVMVLFQAPRPHDVAVLAAIGDYGWEIACEVWWDKGRQRPGNFADAYRPQTERIMVLCRAGNRPRHHNGASGGNILRHRPLQRHAEPALNGTTVPDVDDHYLAKPPALCRELIRRHTAEGELVVDACGCSGNFTLAARELHAGGAGTGAAVVLRRGRRGDVPVGQRPDPAGANRWLKRLKRVKTVVWGPKRFRGRRRRWQPATSWWSIASSIRRRSAAGRPVGAVHREMGTGFAEAVYREAMEIELAHRGIPFERQALLRIHYKGHLLAKEYFAELICFGSVLYELKAQREGGPHEQSQLINYPKATRLRVGLLINFDDPGRLD